MLNRIETFIRLILASIPLVKYQFKKKFGVFMEYGYWRTMADKPSLAI